MSPAFHIQQLVASFMKEGVALDAHMALAMSYTEDTANRKLKSFVGRLRQQAGELERSGFAPAKKVATEVLDLLRGEGSLVEATKKLAGGLAGKDILKNLASLDPAYQQKEYIRLRKEQLDRLLS